MLNGNVSLVLVQFQAGLFVRSAAWKADTQPESDGVVTDAKRDNHLFQSHSRSSDLPDLT